MVATNLRGTYLATRAVGRHMVAQRSGKVINIASNFALQGVGEPCRLLRVEGRDHRIHPLDGGGVGTTRHPGQRLRSRLLRNRAER